MAGGKYSTRQMIKRKLEGKHRPAKKNKVWRSFRKAQRECGCTTKTLKKLAQGNFFSLCLFFCLFVACCLFGMRVCLYAAVATSFVCFALFVCCVFV